MNGKEVMVRPASGVNRDDVERDGAEEQTDERASGSRSDLPRQRFINNLVQRQRSAAGAAGPLQRFVSG